MSRGRRSQYLQLTGTSRVAFWDKSQIRKMLHSYLRVRHVEIALYRLYTQGYSPRRILLPVVLCAVLLHRRAALRRSFADAKDITSGCKGEPLPPHSQTSNIMELQPLKPPPANGQPAWTRNPNIAGDYCRCLDGREKQVHALPSSLSTLKYKNTRK